MPTALGNQLRVARKRKGCTLKDVRFGTGISFSFLSDIERGRTNPSLDTLRKLSAFYGVAIGELMNETNTPPQQPPVPPVPLWSDEDIANDAFRASSISTTRAAIRSCLLFMRHGYEAERAAQNAELVESQKYALQLERENARLTAELAERGLWEPMPAGKMLKLSSRGVGQPRSSNHYIVTRNRVAGRELPNGWAVCRSLRDRLPSSSAGDGDGAAPAVGDGVPARKGDETEGV